MINVLYSLGLGAGVGYLVTHQMLSFVVSAIATAFAILLEE
jgi:hypothetical protein